ncbi:Protein SUP-1 [Dirofilaria immitis]
MPLIITISSFATIILTVFAAADESIFQQRSGNKICGGAICPEGSAFHYYDCCGTLYNECCFHLQTWLVVVLGIVAVIIVASIALSVIKCIFCCD